MRTVRLRDFDTTSLSRRSRDIGTWPQLDEAARRASDACCVYGDCLEVGLVLVGPHYYQRRDLDVMACVDHAGIIR